MESNIYIKYIYLVVQEDERNFTIELIL